MRSLCEILETVSATGSRYHSKTRKEVPSWKPDFRRFAIADDGRLWHWLKNDNEDEEKVWRYQHYRSHGSFAQKRALVVSTLRKVSRFASDKGILRRSAQDKLREFIMHKYPQKLLRSVCNLIATTTNDRTWISIREDIKHINTARLERRH